MRILHLSTVDIEGGAARAAYRLHVGLRQLGYESQMLVAEKKSDDAGVMAFAPPASILSRLTRRMRHDRIIRSFSRYRLSRPEGYERFSDDRSVYGETLASRLPACDVIHLRSVTSFVGCEVFKHLPRQIPLVWTLDDMNPLTGGCHFDDGCGRFADGCGACPQLGSADPKDLSQQIWNRKLRVFSRLDPARLHMVATNRWMKGLLNQSPLFSRFPVTVIPYGLDTDMFCPHPKQAARTLLGLPEEAFIVLFVATSLGLRRKGLFLLAQALAAPLISEKLCLLSLGNGSPDPNIPVPIKHFGKIQDELLLSCIYSAADIFVCPSLQDNLPNTVLEAMACGTPVVAFNVGGIPDMVRPGITGLLAPAGDAVALRHSILELMESPAKRAEMAAACRRVAIEEYGLESQARHYAQLYKTALQGLASQHLLVRNAYSISGSA